LGFILCSLGSNNSQTTSERQVSINKIPTNEFDTQPTNLIDLKDSPIVFTPEHSGTYELSIGNGNVTETIITWLGNGWVTLLVTSGKDGATLGAPLILISKLKDFETNYCWQSRQIFFLQDLVFRHRLAPPAKILQKCVEEPDLNPVASIIVAYHLFDANRLEDLRSLLGRFESNLRTVPDIAILGCLCGLKQLPSSGFPPPIFSRGFQLARNAFHDLYTTDNSSSYFSVEIFFLRYSIITGVLFNGKREDLAERANRIVSRRSALAAVIYEGERSSCDDAATLKILELLKCATSRRDEVRTKNSYWPSLIQVEKLGEHRDLIKRLAHLGGLPANVLVSHISSLLTSSNSAPDNASGSSSESERNRGLDSYLSAVRISKHTVESDSDATCNSTDSHDMDSCYVDGFIGSRGTRKKATAYARLRHAPGNGRIHLLVRGRSSTGRPRTLDYREYFSCLELQTIILRPFDFAEISTNDIEVIVSVRGGGVSGQATAVALAISRSLVKMQPDIRPLLKGVKLLSVDSRVKERKKAGLRKARKGFQYSKR
jgi:small subunit ribosomal protein S9